MPRRKKAERWEGRLGIWPVVVVYGERADKGGVCYLRWWVSARENWQWKSCRTKVRDARGELDGDAQSRVVEMAKRQHDLLTGKISELPNDQRAPITFAGTWAVLTDKDSGRFPTRTRYRDALEASIDDAVKELGAEFAWLHFDEQAFTRVLRRKARDARARGFPGLRAAVALGVSLITIMNVIKEAKRLPAQIAVPGGRRWRGDIKRYVTDLAGGVEPEVQRPRHTIEEARAIEAKAPLVDPRFALMLALGAEQRLGQVNRARRTHLDLERGLFTVPGRGDKKGAIIVLTKGQRAAVTHALTAGYLAHLEGTFADFPLFPQGMLQTERDKPGGRFASEKQATQPPVDRRTINEWFRAAETLAQVPHVRGRAAYGLRRVRVDQALAAGISPDGLQAHGGWNSDRMPQTIYRDQKREQAQGEAAEIRAKLRGEE